MTDDELTVELATTDNDVPLTANRSYSGDWQDVSMRQQTTSQNGARCENGFNKYHFQNFRRYDGDLQRKCKFIIRHIQDNNFAFRYREPSSPQQLSAFIHITRKVQSYTRKTLTEFQYVFRYTTEFYNLLTVCRVPACSHTSFNNVTYEAISL